MRSQIIVRWCQAIAPIQLLRNSTHRTLAPSSHRWGQKQNQTSRSSSCVLCRSFGSQASSSSARHQEVLLPGNIFRSHIPDIDIPVLPFHEFMFKQYDTFKCLPATSEFLYDKSYTFADLKLKAIKVASALTRLGYKKGDIILLFSVNTVDFTVLMLACSCIGVILSSANPAFIPDELVRQINHSESVALFTFPALVPTVNAALQTNNITQKLRHLFVFGQAEGFQPFQSLLDDDGHAYQGVSIDPREDIYLLPYSSGTTGLPKGVMLTHHNVVSNVLQICTSHPIEVQDNVVCLLPLYHIFGMVVVQFAVTYMGGQLHFLPKYEPETFLKCLQDRKIKLAHLVPPLVLFLAKHPLVAKYDLSNLTRIFCGAAPLGKELTLELEQRLSHDIVVTQGYGLTETSPVTNIDCGKNLGAVGHLLCNTLGKITDLNSGEPLGPHQEGEFCLKGPQVMKGYFNNQAATDEMVTPDGWLKTGDIGYFNEEGVLFISDRLKELIKYKGSQVAPAELEGHLLTHEAVQDVAVTGVPHLEAGELPRAFVVKKPGASVDEDALVKYLDERVSHTKRLRGGVVFVDDIPKNPSGKILRRLLKDTYL